MYGRYNFQFYKHKCGRTISIDDTEPCECEKPVCEPVEIINQAAQDDGRGYSDNYNWGVE